MFTHHKAVPDPAPVYWTQRAHEAFFDGIVDAVPAPQDTVGYDLVVGHHAGAIDDAARACGLDHVNQNFVTAYFHRLVFGERQTA